MRSDFPLLRGQDVAYLDNAATTQKHDRVIEAEKTFYETSNANPHRSMYDLANDATSAVESTREAYAEALGAEPEEIIFTRNATEALNQTKACFAKQVGSEDNVVITELEHHSNFLPWQQLTKETGASLTVVPHDDVQNIEGYVDDNTALVAFTHMSNVTGEYLPVQDITAAVQKQTDAYVVVDGCQAFPHTSVDLGELGVDAYMFSSHKHYGPTGVGILYLKRGVHDEVSEPLVGGGMVDTVTEDGYVTSQAPHRFEAGTLNAAGIAASKDALQFVEANRERIKEVEDNLLEYALQRLNDAGIDYYGHDHDRYGPVISLNISQDAYDVAHVLNEHDVCIRSGNHCANPLMNALGTTNTARISLGCYNNEDDIDNAIHGLQEAKDILGGTL